MTKEQHTTQRLVLIKNLVRELITASINSRRVGILEAGNELISLLPPNHPNRQIVNDTAWEMHMANRPVIGG